LNLTGNFVGFLSSVVILGFRSCCVEVRVAEVCSVSYVDVIELHCTCGLVARTVTCVVLVFTKIAGRWQMAVKCMHQAPSVQKNLTSFMSTESTLDVKHLSPVSYLIHASVFVTPSSGRPLRYLLKN
jgi:hypothetical protein